MSRDSMRAGSSESRKKLKNTANTNLVTERAFCFAAWQNVCNKTKRI